MVPIKTQLAHRSNYGGKRTAKVEWIVMHYTANDGDSDESNARYFQQALNPVASAHYFVDDDSITRSVPDDYVAYHCGAVTYKHPTCRNANSIGVEMCDAKRDGKVMATEKTIANAAELVYSLCKQYKIPYDHIIRHYDVTGKQCLPTDTTELLTRDGWKNISEISTGDEVMAVNPNEGTAAFSTVLDMVEPYEAEVINCRGFEATTDHRMWAKPNCPNSHEYREVQYGYMMEGKKQYLIPTSAYYTAPGIDLTDSQLQLLVWVQGDGHYMKGKNGKICGLEFHLKKQRKIDRVREVLDANLLPYTECQKSDGSVSLRTYDTSVVDWCETWLSNKEFTYRFLDMDQGQFSIFAEEILDVDGCRAANCYTSTSANNLDVVQAIAATHGVRSHIGPLGGGSDTSVHFSCSNRTIGGLLYTPSKRRTEVSCVTVETGYILIRQNKDTYVVGNCPAYWVNGDGLAKFRKQVEEVGEVVTDSYMIVDGKKVTVKRILKDGTNYVKVRDIAAALNLDVGNQGNIAVLTTKK